MFPLPRIDDLLDQLGESKFFSTLDLASGYWQVQVHPDTVAFYEFRVMPFGLKNAPAVDLCLEVSTRMPFVSVYLDDVLVFSRTFKDHLQLVVERLLA